MPEELHLLESAESAMFTSMALLERCSYFLQEGYGLLEVVKAPDRTPFERSQAAESLALQLAAIRSIAGTVNSNLENLQNELRTVARVGMPAEEDEGGVIPVLFKDGVFWRDVEGNRYLLEGTALPPEEGNVVHVLRHGLTLCGFGEGKPPKDWPQGHSWFSYEADLSSINCLRCAEIFQSEEQRDGDA